MELIKKRANAGKEGKLKIATCFATCARVFNCLEESKEAARSFPNCFVSNWMLQFTLINSMQIVFVGVMIVHWRSIQGERDSGKNSLTYFYNTNKSSCLLRKALRIDCVITVFDLLNFLTKINSVNNRKSCIIKFNPSPEKKFGGKSQCGNFKITWSRILDNKIKSN